MSASCLPLRDSVTRPWWLSGTCEEQRDALLRQDERDGVLRPIRPYLSGELLKMSALCDSRHWGALGASGPCWEFGPDEGSPAP